MKVFYDHLILLDEIFVRINSLSISQKERKELLELIDNIVHHRVIESILDVLPLQFHDDFLERFYKNPHHTKHLIFLEEKANVNITLHLVGLNKKIQRELLNLLKKAQSEK